MPYCPLVILKKKKNIQIFINCNLCSPRDATSGLGVKMVEYVLGGSPTNKDSPLSSLEPRLRSLKFDDNDKVSFKADILSSAATWLFIHRYFRIDEILNDFAFE